MSFSYRREGGGEEEEEEEEDVEMGVKSAAGVPSDAAAVDAEAVVVLAVVRVVAAHASDSLEGRDTAHPYYRSNSVHVHQGTRVSFRYYYSMKTVDDDWEEEADEEVVVVTCIVFRPSRVHGRSRSMSGAACSETTTKTTLTADDASTLAAARREIRGGLDDDMRLATLATKPRISSENGLDVVRDS
ncbi:hypothetical protein AA313_de0209397 [Arthrobotrys entomopaga]|nr:hypothetical protein AA313_de0209397 [Arthrobotrys entomopaga]